MKIKNFIRKNFKKLISNGYSYNDFGVDYNNIYWSFKNKTNIWNNWISKLMPYIHRKQYKHLNKIIVSIDSKKLINKRKQL